MQKNSYVLIIIKNKNRNMNCEEYRIKLNIDEYLEITQLNFGLTNLLLKLINKFNYKENSYTCCVDILFIVKFIN